MGQIYSAMTPDNRLYIGQTVGNYKTRRYGHNSYARCNKGASGIYEAINEFGEDSIEWGVILDGVNPLCLDVLEEWYILITGSYVYGLNRTPSSRGPKAISDETKKLISKNRTGMKFTDSHKNTMSIVRKGIPLPNSWKENVVLALRKNPPHNRKVEVFGIKYKSGKDASTTLGIGKTTWHRWLKSGKNGARYI